MKKITLGKTGKQWLKSNHIIVSAIWLGAAISIDVLRWVWVPSANGDLYAVDHAIGLIDNWVVVPAAWASLLTGLLESWLTTWGFFKFRWVTVKWIGTLAIMIYAPLFIAQWDRHIETISKAEGLLVLQNPTYLDYRGYYTVSAIAFIIILAFLSIVSTFKPWTRQDRLNAQPRGSKMLANAKAEG